MATHRTRVYRYLLRLTGDPYLADDLTQETMLRGVQRAATLREPLAVLAWLYRVATNIFLDRRRADRRQPIGPLCTDEPRVDRIEDIPAPGPASDRLVEIGEMSTCVREYLKELPHHYRVAILLHDGYGLSDQEVAETLGISLANAKMRIHRARTRLRAALSAACQFELDDRGVLVCQRAPDQPDCPPDCACHGGPRTRAAVKARSGRLVDRLDEGDQLP